MDYGLIGTELSHSLSPRIHQWLGNYDYELVPLTSDQLEPFLVQKDFLGINVTIPYKQIALTLCDTVSPTAERCSAVNTIIKYDDGFLCGYNTDYAGFNYLLEHFGYNLNRKKILVLGNGGAAHTIRTVAQDKGAGVIIMASRQGRINFENLYQFNGFQVIINATPLGMSPDDAAPVDLTQFPHCQLVLDLVYSPQTRLLQDAKNLGIACSDGLAMLVAQAKQSSDLFLNMTRSDHLIDQIYQQLIAELDLS